MAGAQIKRIKCPETIAKNFWLREEAIVPNDFGRSDIHDVYWKAYTSVSDWFSNFTASLRSKRRIHTASWIAFIGNLYINV